MNATVKKELYVAVHGQTARFRIVKYIVIAAIGWAVHSYYGWEGVWWALGVGLVLALAMHFFFRYMTNGWQDDWGLYKSVFKK